MVEDEPLHKDAQEGAAPAGVVLEPSPSLGGSAPSSPPARVYRGYCRLLTQEQREAACKMAAMDVSPERIAAILETKLSLVTREFRRKSSQRRVEALKGELVLREVEQHFGLMGMLPKARKVLDGGLDTGDTKTRTQIAQWLHEATISRPTVKTQLTIQGKVEHDLAPLFAQMGEHLAALRDHNRGRDPLARVQIGSAALVRAALPERTE